MESRIYILKGKEEIAEGVFRLALAPKSGEPIRYCPGQFMILTAPSGIKRAYSISSSPSMELLEFAIKNVEGAFTSQIPSMEKGTKLQVDGPFGPCPHIPSSDNVFIAGGVGITPMLSILRSLDGEKVHAPIFLFYSARSEKGLLFFDELKELESRNPNLRCIFTLTREPPPGWEHEKGRIDAEMLKKHLGNLEKSI